MTVKTQEVQILRCDSKSCGCTHVEQIGLNPVPVGWFTLEEKVHRGMVVNHHFCSLGCVSDYVTNRLQEVLDNE